MTYGLCEHPTPTSAQSAMAARAIARGCHGLRSRGKRAWKAPVAKRVFRLRRPRRSFGDAARHAPFCPQKQRSPRSGPRNTKEPPKTRPALPRQRARRVGGRQQGGTVAVVRLTGASVSIDSVDQRPPPTLVSADALELIAQTRNAKFRARLYHSHPTQTTYAEGRGVASPFSTSVRLSPNGFGRPERALKSLCNEL
jgi:hypothetical protein